VKPGIASVISGLRAFEIASLSALRTTMTSISRSSIQRASCERIADSVSGIDWRAITRCPAAAAWPATTSTVARSGRAGSFAIARTPIWTETDGTRSC